MTSRAAKKKYQQLLNEERQRHVEKVIAAYVQERFSLMVLRVDEKVERMQRERKIISTLPWCQECRPPASWLGLHSPKEKIRKSSLRLVIELFQSGLSGNNWTN